MVLFPLLVGISLVAGSGIMPNEDNLAVVVTVAFGPAVNGISFGPGQKLWVYEKQVSVRPPLINIPKLKH
jgi:hypothetical protein